MLDTSRCLPLLHRWAQAAEPYWQQIPAHPGLGCYGTGYNAWGVQTNQKYLAAMAALAMLGEGVAGLDRAWAMARALAALRFSLYSHVSGGGVCTDGAAWGHTWISALGVERMMYGVDLLAPELTDDDHAALRRMLCSEAEWICRHHRRGQYEGICADPWGSSGKNHPESNLWNGALLWRTAVRYPDHPQADDWREMAHRFLINSVSVPSDAKNEAIVAGQPVRARFVGANFFPHYSLDHHGYLNVGYMVICLSNAAMLHFDMKARGEERPASLDHHEHDLWQVVRRMVFADGRLARIGGDSRVRYVYCQDYLLPALLYAADRLGDAHALELASRLLDMMAREAEINGDGNFLSHRLSAMRHNPYYYCRLESDRACVLGMAAAYARHVHPPAAVPVAFEETVHGGWCEPEHGAVLHRTPTRLASFAWRAYGYAQGMCQPPDDGHLAEWSNNLAGRVRCLGDSGEITALPSQHRALLRQHIDEFDGGFITYGALQEGRQLQVAEGWSGSCDLTHQLVFAALPDAHTVVGLQHCRNGALHAYLLETKGLLLNIPNDLFNGYRRTLETAQGAVSVVSPATEEAAMSLQGCWAAVDGRIGALGLYGADTLALHRSPQRRGGKFASLYVDELCFHCRIDTQLVYPGEVVLDVGWAVLSGVDAEGVRQMAAANAGTALVGLPDEMRGVRLTALDGCDYLVLANFGDMPVALSGGSMLGGSALAVNLADSRCWCPAEEISLAPGEAGVWRLD